MALKFGLKPVTAHPTVRLCSYYTPDLPSVDSLKFPLGHSDAIQPHMYCNDIIGCCAIAGSIEEIRLANALRGVTVNFTDKTTVENYTAITEYQMGPEIGGFNPDGSAIENPQAPQNDTDQGTDIHALYVYRKTTGFVDADGNRHKIIGYAGLTPGNWDELLIALSIFQMVGIGINVPDYAEQQFAAGKPWDVVPSDTNNVGGHYIPVVDAPSATEVGVFTWGARTTMTKAFYEQQSIAAVVALPDEDLTNTALEGIAADQLAKDLRALNTGSVE